MFIGFPSGQVTMITFIDKHLFNLSHFFSVKSHDGSRYPCISIRVKTKDRRLSCESQLLRFVFTPTSTAANQRYRSPAAFFGPVPTVDAHYPLIRGPQQ